MHALYFCYLCNYYPPKYAKMVKSNTDTREINKLESSSLVSSNLKGGSFLTKTTDPKSIFISEEWNEEQQMMADMVKEFCVKIIQEKI